MFRHFRLAAAIALSLTVLFVVGVGCSRKPKPVVVPAVTQTPATEPAKPAEPVAQTPAPATLELQDVFFDYDRSTLREDARTTLTANGKVLLENPDAAVLLEGHCDERGTVEYNLALGERRANSARNFLVQYGIAASRLNTISYGEERPFAAGQGESAWSQNRRVHFVKQ